MTADSGSAQAEGVRIVSEQAQSLILKAGVISIPDQLTCSLHRTVTPCSCLVLGKAERCTGKAPGTPHSHTKPYVCSKGQKFELARVERPAMATKTNPESYIYLKEGKEKRKVQLIK